MTEKKKSAARWRKEKLVSTIMRDLKSEGWYDDYTKADLKKERAKLMKMSVAELNEPDGAPC